MNNKQHGGIRQGAGRKTRPSKKSRTIWCGQVSEEDRDFIISQLSPDERFRALMAMANTGPSGRDYTWEEMINNLPEFLAGKKAFMEGLDISANPHYPDNVKQHITWSAGWRDAHLNVLQKVRPTQRAADASEEWACKKCGTVNHDIRKDCRICGLRR